MNTNTGRRWRKISTAPKDGTQIWARFDVVPVIAWYSGGEWKCKELIAERQRETRRRKAFKTVFQRHSPLVNLVYEPKLWLPL